MAQSPSYAQVWQRLLVGYRSTSLSVAMNIATHLLLIVCFLLVLSHCSQVIPPCQEKVWDITYAPSAQEGQATLVVTVPSLTGKVTEKLQSVSSILTCDDLQVNGTGKSVLELNKGHNTASYDVAVPEANNLEEFESQGDWGTHSCILQFTYHPTTKTTDKKGQSVKEVKCELKLKTLLGRILPKCNLKRAQSLLLEVEVSKDDGQVLIQYGQSANDVFTYDGECDVGSIDHHTHEEALEENKLPLAPPGADSPLIDIDYYPDCDNETMRKEFSDHEMSGCHIEIYQVCQEGHQLVKKLDLEFNKGALLCDPPKPSYQVLLEKLELMFYIQSRPVVALLAWLLLNGLLYSLLIPVVVFKLVQSSGSSKTTTSEETQPLLANQQSPPQSPPPLPPTPPPLPPTPPPLPPH